MAEITVSEINRRITADGAATVAREEKRYRDAIAAIADRVVTGGVRVLLLAGPSAAGKTTTANLLADQIRARTHRCEVVSLDNFYREMDDPAYPRLPDGTQDFECAEALELPLVVSCLSDILAGRGFSVPRYDFKRQAREQGTAYEPLTAGCVIVEGLHALNPAITEPLPHERLLRLFVSVSTNITDDGGVRLMSGKKMRFVRRLVRDSLYRNADAARTYRLWQNVLAGEERYLYPYRDRADVYLDTFHAYEPGALRGIALPMLAELPSDAYLDAVTGTLSRVMPMAEDFVPQTSLLREFLPGGIYEHLY